MIIYLKGLSLIGAGIFLTQLLVSRGLHEREPEPMYAGLLLILAGILEVKEKLDLRKLD